MGLSSVGKAGGSGGNRWFVFAVMQRAARLAWRGTVLADAPDARPHQLHRGGFRDPAHFLPGPAGLGGGCRGPAGLSTARRAARRLGRKLVIRDAQDKTSEVKAVLKVEPIPGTRELTWRMTTGEGEISSTTDAKLVPAGDAPGRFRMEEGRVALEARLANGVLYTRSETGALRTTWYELRGDVLRYEMTWSKPAPAKTGGGNVQGYAIEVVQMAELKKK
jgi:hypothetical protein